MFRLLCLLLGYGLGCLQSAYVVGRLFGKIDIREHGSGNAGTTNVLRVMGFRAGVFVFLFDLSKGLLGFMICSFIFNGSCSFFVGNSYLPGLYGGLGVILGHNFPFFLKFKGGKGVAASLGLIIALDVRVMLVCFAIGIVTLSISKYMALGSLSVNIFLPLSMLFFGFVPEAVFLGFIMMALCIYKHKTNLVRLKNGTENKFSFRKQKPC